MYNISSVFLGLLKAHLKYDNIRAYITVCHCLLPYTLSHCTEHHTRIHKNQKAWTYVGFLTIYVYICTANAFVTHIFQNRIHEKFLQFFVAHRCFIVGKQPDDNITIKAYTHTVYLQFIWSPLFDRLLPRAYGAIATTSIYIKLKYSRSEVDFPENFMKIVSKTVYMLLRVEL